MKNKYPVFRYHETKQPDGLIVYSEKEDKTLGPGWVHSPALFKVVPEQPIKRNQEEAALALATPAEDDIKKPRKQKGAKE